MRAFLLIVVLCGVSLNARSTPYPGPISFSVILADDAGRVISRDVVDAQDNYPAQVNRTQQARFPSCQRFRGGQMDCTYATVTTGLQFSAVPSMQSDGRIVAQLDVLYSVLDSTQMLKYDEIEVELPQVITSTLKQRIILNPGKELSMPFGLVINGRNLYTLRIAAVTGRAQPAASSGQSPAQSSPLLNILLEAVK